jgi:predicted nucleic acid-binding protein
VTTPTASDSVVLDSSGWLEYLTADSKADSFARYLEGELSLLVPVIVLYEVRRILLVRKSKTLADIFLSEALKRVIIPLDEMLALEAIELGISHNLALADAIIYATAQHHGAQLVTSDAHFTNLPGVTLL